MKEGILEKIRLFLSEHARRHGAGIFVTLAPGGQPHATWMGTVASPRLDRVLTMTSPSSRKIVNLLENPRVEWLLADAKMRRILYLRGRARVLEQPPEVEAAWAALNDKSRAWFLRFQEKVGIQFLIVETEVEEIEYQEPAENLVEVVQVRDLAEAVRGQPFAAAGWSELGT